MMQLTPLFEIKSATFASETKTAVSEAKHSFRRRARKLGQPQRWTLDLTSRRLPYPKAMAVIAQLNRLDGQHGAIAIPNPFPVNGRATLVTVSVSAAKGSDAVVVDVGAVEVVTALAPGDFVQFPGHAKVYQVAEWQPVTRTLTCYPQLKAAVASGAAVSLGRAVHFHCHYNSDEVSLEVTNVATKLPILAKFIENV